MQLVVDSFITGVLAYPIVYYMNIMIYDRVDHHFFPFANWFPQNRYDYQPIYSRCHPDRSLRQHLFAV